MGRKKSSSPFSKGGLRGKGKQRTQPAPDFSLRTAPLISENSWPIQVAQRWTFNPILLQEGTPCLSSALPSWPCQPGRRGARSSAHSAKHPQNRQTNMPLKSQDPSRLRETSTPQGAEQGSDRGMQKSVAAASWFELRLPDRDSKFNGGNVQREGARYIKCLNLATAESI